MHDLETGQYSVGWKQCKLYLKLLWNVVFPGVNQVKNKVTWSTAIKKKLLTKHPRAFRPTNIISHVRIIHRITEVLGLEGNSGDYQVQLPAKVGSLQRLHRKVSSLVLNFISREGDSASLGSLFQCCQPHNKDVFHVFVWDLPCSGLCELHHNTLQDSIGLLDPKGYTAGSWWLSVMCSFRPKDTDSRQAGCEAAVCS